MSWWRQQQNRLSENYRALICSIFHLPMLHGVLQRLRSNKWSTEKKSHIAGVKHMALTMANIGLLTYGEHLYEIPQECLGPRSSSFTKTSWFLRGLKKWIPNISWENLVPKHTKKWCFGILPLPPIVMEVEKWTPKGDEPVIFQAPIFHWTMIMGERVGTSQMSCDQLRSKHAQEQPAQTKSTKISPS